MRTNRVLKLAAVLLATASVMFACTPKDDEREEIAVLPFGTCQGCSGYNPAMIFAAPATGIPMFPAEFSIQAFGDAMMIQNLAVYTTSVAKLYSGPVYIQGTMHMPVTSTIGYCVIPAGVYQFQTLQAGRMSSGIITVPQVELLGPTRVTISMAGNVVLDPNADGFVDRIGGRIHLLQASGYAGAMVGCNDIAGIELR